jgi:hypothetical protein
MTRARSYSVGSTPPEIVWTIVSGDTASFRVYVTDDTRTPITVADWDIEMDIARNGSVIVALTPAAAESDDNGEFTVSLTSQQSALLRTGDVFDIQLSDATRVWTVATGTMTVIDDVTS